MNVTESQRRQIEDLHTRYIRLIDDDRLETWPDLFTDYCLYRITTRDDDSLMECQGRGMLADRVGDLRKLDEPHRYLHQTSGLSIESFDGETAVCVSNYLVTRTTPEGETRIFSVGVYLDRVAFDGDAPKFEQRIVLSDSLPRDTLLMVPL
jgi:anthranilate 1,2-dioxygenase small subunit